jgi:hypothetical protein
MHLFDYSWLKSGAQDLVVQQPGRVVVHAQVEAELHRGDASLGLIVQIEGQEPSGQSQFGGLHDRAGLRWTGFSGPVPSLTSDAG